MPENTGSNTKEKKPRLAPAVVFPPPVQPLRPVQIPGNPSVDPRLGHVWPRHLVLLSPYPPWTTQPPVPRESIPSDSHHHHQRMSNAPRTDANTPLEVIDEKLLPKVDMLFDSENEAYEFYNTYAENVVSSFEDQHYGQHRRTLLQEGHLYAHEKAFVKRKKVLKRPSVQGLKRE
uniref:Protein FAR1-RELATED SEQUENCE n=1 Tax=Ananas comosus var. bracteatus TaxID=296719 RepID=A0A6V7QYE1_ANACO